MIYHINYDWTFIKSELKGDKSQFIQNGEIIHIPHTNQEIPYNYVDERDYQFVSTYQKIIDYQPLWKDKKITIHFESVAHQATVYINGTLLGVHSGGYTPFEFDLTAYLNQDINILTVIVDSRETLNFPPFGNVIDYLTYGGIYREVYLNIRNHRHIQDVFVYGKNLLSLPEIHVDSTFSTMDNLSYEVSILYKDTLVHQEQFNVSNAQSNIIFKSYELKLWDIDNPNLYTLNFALKDDKEILDELSITTGFRDAMFKPDGFYLNGNKIKLIGMNRHQDYPYVGYAMPKSAQYMDANILKNELNMNIVRTSHYPQSKHFIKACDELGLLVFEEIPGWQHIGDENWKNIAKTHTKEMVLRDRNNPSVILWGVRINESGDDDLFYKDTNDIAHKNDPTRQTAGVRFITHSSVLEDVFAFNDFIHEGHNEPLRKLSDVTHLKNVPYLVTEHSGHMFPTKSFDPEQKRLEHAKRHMRITNHMLNDDDISGVIGWCMHDYNTHIDFGSGDKICYHGVLDMYRNPKMAAYFYTSQQDHTPYLEISTNFNIGEYPKGFIEDALIFSNCEEVFVYRNEMLIGSLSHDQNYPYLKYPPFQMDWFGDLLIKNEGLTKEKSDLIKKIYKSVVIFGQHHLPKDILNLIQDSSDIHLAYQMYGKYVANWGTKSISYTFKGYNNKTLVISKTRGNDYKSMLRIQTDTTNLFLGNTYDVTRITVEAVNEHQDRLIFANDAFMVETDKLLSVIGEKNLSLIGGIRSFFVKTNQIEGLSTIQIQHRNQIHKTQVLVSKEELS